MDTKVGFLFVTVETKTIKHGQSGCCNKIKFHNSYKQKQYPLFSCLIRINGQLGSQDEGYSRVRQKCTLPYVGGRNKRDSLTMDVCNFGAKSNKDHDRISDEETSLTRRILSI